MLNSCILTGNLGADPEIFYSSEGEPIATFNMSGGGRLLNYFKGSVWFVVLILVIISVAFILSILPQEIRWILFILSIAYIIIQIVYRSSR